MRKLVLDNPHPLNLRVSKKFIDDLDELSKEVTKTSWAHKALPKSEILRMLLERGMEVVLKELKQTKTKPD